MTKRNTAINIPTSRTNHLSHLQCSIKFSNQSWSSLLQALLALVSGL